MYASSYLTKPHNIAAIVLWFYCGLRFNFVFILAHYRFYTILVFVAMHCICVIIIVVAAAKRMRHCSYAKKTKPRPTQ